MSLATWFAFLAVSLAATFSPGPAVLLAMTTTLAVGPRRTAWSSAGNGLGIFIVASIAVTGVGVLLRTSASAFLVLKLCGAAYLVFLGWKQWRAPSTIRTDAAPGGPVLSARAALFRRGLLVALSNPKAIMFFTAIFPQFIQADHPNLAHFLLLSLTFVACSFASHTAYVLLARALLGGRLPDGALAWINRLGGVVFVGLGCAMLMQSAPLTSAARASAIAHRIQAGHCSMPARVASACGNSDAWRSTAGMASAGKGRDR